MHPIEHYYPNINSLSRDDLVEELRNAKNEVLWLAELAKDVLAPAIINNLPTFRQLHERERLQGIATKRIDEYIEGLNRADNKPKRVGCHGLALLRLRVKNLWRIDGDFGGAFAQVVSEANLENSNDLYDLCTNGGMKPFEGD